jgi:hypothetical protein
MPDPGLMGSRKSEKRAEGEAGDGSDINAFD